MLNFDNMSNSDLDKVVGNFVKSFPSAGQITLAGYLRAQGFKIQRRRIRESFMLIHKWC